MTSTTILLGLAIGLGILMSRKPKKTSGVPPGPSPGPLLEPRPAPGQLETPMIPYDHYPSSVSREGFPAPEAPDQLVVNSTCTRINVPHAWFETVAAPQIQEKLVDKPPTSSADFSNIAMQVISRPLGSCPPDTPAMREFLNDVTAFVETIYTG